MALPTIDLVTVDALPELSRPHDLVAAQRPGEPSQPQAVITGAIPADSGVIPDDAGARLAADFGVDLDRRLRRANASGKAGEIVVVELEDDVLEQLIVVGLGDGSPDAARAAGAAVAGHLNGVQRAIAGVTSALSQPALRAFSEGLLLASYSFSMRSSTPGAAPGSPAPAVGLAVASPAKAQEAISAATVTAAAVALARTLANTPSNIKNPRWLADQAAELARSGKLRIRVLGSDALRRDRFGGLLAVGAGSATPPALVQLEHRGDPGQPHVVLIGKGITFDSGGLSIKPAESMAAMKTDMSGAAAVLGVMSALRALAVPVRVTALLACAENMPGANSYRPGDVIRHFGGRTSEVLNTDAEGRLVLADALAYADLRLQPDVVVDIATLTGAATVGLSPFVGALYTRDDGLAGALQQAGDLGHDPVWRMPLVDEYRPALESPIADLAQVPHDSAGGGSITAALFLEEFAGARRWVHLDIAGPARAASQRAEVTRGGTGFGVRLLLRWLEDPVSRPLW